MEKKFLKLFSVKFSQTVFGSDAIYQQNFVKLGIVFVLFSTSVEFKEYDDYLGELVHASKYLNRNYLKEKYKSSIMNMQYSYFIYWVNR